MTKAEQMRMWAWRCKVLRQAGEGTRNVARTCRHFGISRQAFYRWKRRYAAHGEAGLWDRPRTPHRSPKATPQEVVSKILYLRQHYHFGPRRIADYLQRFHRQSVAPSSVHRILVRHGLNRLPANQKPQAHGKRWQRYEKAQPGHRLQVDVKFLERIPGTRTRLYQFTAIDDCTRIRVLKVYDACPQASAMRFVDEVLRRLPFRVLVIQTDNGAEFQSRFHWHLQALDIRHVYIRPRTPHLNGKVERSRRIDAQEFYQLLDKDGVTDDIHLFNEKLREWRTTTTITARTARSTARPRTSVWLRRRERECHRCLRVLHPWEQTLKTIALLGIQAACLNMHLRTLGSTRSWFRVTATAVPLIILAFRNAGMLDASGPDGLYFVPLVASIVDACVVVVIGVPLQVALWIKEDDPTPAPRHPSALVGVALGLQRKVAHAVLAPDVAADLARDRAPVPPQLPRDRGGRVAALAQGPNGVPVVQGDWV